MLHMRLLLLAMGFAVCSAIANTKSSTPQSRRRRRRNDAIASNDGKSSCDVFQKVMSELLEIQKDMRAAKEEIKELQGANKKLQATNENIMKEMVTLKKQMPPFTVDTDTKTVWLKDWNLHIAANIGWKPGQPSCLDCGNLVVGLDHNYKNASNSFFSGSSHTAVGSGNAFLGGLRNSAGKLSTEDGGKFVDHYMPVSFAALAGGTYNSAIPMKSGQQKTSHFCFLGGGQHNGCSGHSATVLGGIRNAGLAEDVVVVGGTKNQARGYTSVIVGGADHLVDNSGTQAVAVGGFRNQANGYASVVVGGADQVVDSGGNFGTIAGGRYGKIHSSYCSFVGGGEHNSVGGDSSVGGGVSYGTVNGGHNNTIREGATWGSIAGGFSNVVRRGGSWGTVAGGRNNVVESIYSAISGGYKNHIVGETAASTISGGWANLISQGNSFGSAIAGGYGNSIEGGAIAGMVSGGANNTMSSQFSSIAGGLGNLIRGGRGGCIRINATGTRRRQRDPDARRRRQRGLDSLRGPGDEHLDGKGECGNWSAYHTISGGSGNTIDTRGYDAFNNAIVGGQNNSILTDASFSAILGGRRKETVNESWSVIVGGLEQELPQGFAKSFNAQHMSKEEREHYDKDLERLTDLADTDLDEAEQTAAEIDVQKLSGEGPP